MSREPSQETNVGEAFEDADLTEHENGEVEEEPEAIGIFTLDEGPADRFGRGPPCHSNR